MARLRVLDAWRGVAALLVALFHAKMLAPELASAPAFKGLAAFVDFFFVLSGYVLASGYGRPDFALPTFAWRRIARLAPLHVYALSILLLLEAGKSALASLGWMRFGESTLRGSGPASYLDNLFLLQVTGLLGDRITWNTPSWSLSAELAANLIVGGLVVLLARRWLVQALAVIVAAAALVFSLGLLPQTDYGPAALLRCLYAFAAGHLLYRSAGAWRTWPTGAAAAIAEGAAVVAIIAAVLLGPAGYWAAATPLFAFAILVFAREAGPLSRLMLAARLDGLGDISYSVYLNHWALVLVMEKAQTLVPTAILPPGPAKTLVVVAVYLAIVVVYSRWTWRTIELPGQALLLRALPSRRRPSLPVAEPAR